MNLKSELRKFFKYFEGTLDKEMFQIYHQALSEYPESAVIARLHDLICNRNKTYKLPGVSEITAPYVNAEKDFVWKKLMDHLNNPYEPMPNNMYLLKKHLDVPNNRTEYAMSKIKDQFYDYKYHEFKLFFEKKIDNPALRAIMRKFKIDINECQLLEAGYE